MVIRHVPASAGVETTQLHWSGSRGCVRLVRSIVASPAWSQLCHHSAANDAITSSVVTMRANSSVSNLGFDTQLVRGHLNSTLASSRMRSAFPAACPTSPACSCRAARPTAAGAQEFRQSRLLRDAGKAFT